MRVCVVTVAIGERYLVEYTSLFRPSHEFYALKHGYDFKVIADYLDPGMKHPDSISMHKLLLCSQPWSMDYDYIVYVDADILINRNAPPIHLAAQFGDKIGMIDEASQPTWERRLAIQKKMGWELYPTEYMALSGFDFQTDIIYNGGCMVLQPAKHRTLLESIYLTHALKSIGHPRQFHYEQAVLNICLQKADMVAPISHMFNAPWPLYNIDDPSLQIEEFYRSVYFMHLTGHSDYERVPQLWNESV